MRHANRNKKFGREKNERKALMRALAVALVDKERITTTMAKAKSLRPFVERLVTSGKGGTVASRRLLASKLGDRAARKISVSIGPKYKDRKGGYLRVVKLPRRVNDGSPMAIIEFV